LSFHASGNLREQERTLDLRQPADEQEIIVAFGMPVPGRRCDAPRDDRDRFMDTVEGQECPRLLPAHHHEIELADQGDGEAFDQW
jgi:hypothetical protein